MRLPRLLATLAALIATVAAASARQHGELDGARLSKAVAGATLHLDSPIGLTLPIQFAPDGGMTGEAGGLAFFLGASRDRGRWWIADNKLCKKWNVWFEAKAKCVWVRMDGNTIRWRHADGSTGHGVIIARKTVVADGVAGTGAASLTSGASSSTERRPASAIAPTVVTPSRPALAAASAVRSIEAPGKGHALEKPSLPQPAASGTAQAAPIPPKPQLLSPRLAALATLDAKLLPVSPPLPAMRPAALAAAGDQGPSVPTSLQQTAGQPAAVVGSPRPAATTFRVVEVDRFDVLNVRSGPSEAFGVIATIPPDGRDVVLTGRCLGDWCPVSHRSRSGWVNSYYLEPEPRAVTARARPSSYSYDVQMNLGALPPAGDRR